MTDLAAPASMERLRRKQRKREILLTRVEKAATRLERRKRRLTRIDTQIAGLEREVSEPQARAVREVVRVAPPRPAQLIFDPTADPDPTAVATRLVAVLTGLRAHGIEASIGLGTTSPEARHLAREAVRSRTPLVVVAGGDNILGAVAAELIDSSTILGIVPIGTMSNVARSLGVPDDIAEACSLIGAGTMRQIDMGRLYTGNPPQVEHFMEIAGVGLDAIAALTGEGPAQGHRRLWQRALRHYVDSKPRPLRITLDDRVVETHSRLVTVSNTPYMGDHLMLAPDARMDDGFLDVVIYDGMSEAALARHFMAAAASDPPRLESYRSRFVRIAATGTMPANADLSIAARSRVVDIEIAPRALRVMAGSGIGLSASPAAVRGIAKPEGSPRVNGVATQPRLDRTAEPAFWSPAGIGRAHDAMNGNGNGRMNGHGIRHGIAENGSGAVEADPR